MIRLRCSSVRRYSLLLAGSLDVLLRTVPEGTVHSANERGKSAKFAEKSGLVSSCLPSSWRWQNTMHSQDDLKNCLLPRSTGLQFCLRALSPRLPNLELIDLTIGYEGVPAGGFGEEYYTVRKLLKISMAIT